MRKIVVSISLLIYFLFIGKNNFGQTLLVDRIWVCTKSSIKQSENLIDGFAIYYFNKNGIFETQDTNQIFNWKYVKKYNVIKISNKNKSYKCKIIQNTIDSLTLDFKKSIYYFTRLDDSTSISNCNLLDTIIINKNFINVNDSNRTMRLNKNNSIEFIGENINYDILNDKKWNLIHFKKFFFLLIYPDIIVYQIVNSNKEFILISLDKHKSSNFSTKVSE